MFCASPSLHVIGSLKKLCLKKENVAVLLGTFRCHVLKSTCLLEAHHSQAHPVIGSYGGTRVLETKISQFSVLLFLQSRRHHTHVGKKLTRNNTSACATNSQRQQRKTAAVGSTETESGHHSRQPSRRDEDSDYSPGFIVVVNSTILSKHFSHCLKFLFVFLRSRFSYT